MRLVAGFLLFFLLGCSAKKPIRGFDVHVPQGCYHDGYLRDCILIDSKGGKKLQVCKTVDLKYSESCATIEVHK